MLDMPRLPLAEWVNQGVRWMRTEYRAFFNAISDQVEWLVEGLETALLAPMPLVFGILLLLSLMAGGWRLVLLTGLGFGLIENLGYWEEAMTTMALVLSAGAVCLVLGVPAGIAVARSKRIERVVRPTLDFMQTMPAFVYLVPAITFFRVGVVSALFATVVFALPPIVRLVAHGIQHVDREVLEASEAFGAHPWQTLVKVQLPLARPSIMVGVNQMLMMSLSMVVIASMVGAQGLGGAVYAGVSTLNSGLAFEGGICIVVVAVVLDRLTQGIGTRQRGQPLFRGTLASMKATLQRTVGLRPSREVAEPMEAVTRQ